MKNGARPAAPAITIQRGDNYNPDMRIYHAGMSKREAFAMAAMQGMCANPTICTDRKDTAAQVAEWSVQQADALLAELAKETPNGQ